MKLNHDIYEEAMANVKLPEETGMRLLQEAAQQKQRQGQKWKLRAAAFVAAILTVGISLNGICYAQTGKNALEMFISIYQGTNMDELTTLADETRESGESITHENIRFTLEYYWYDTENMEAFYAVRMDSLDGKPLDMETIRESYSILPNACYASSLNAGNELSDDKMSSLEYYYTADAYDKGGNPLDNMEIKIRKFQEDIGSFTLAPTGRANARYAGFDALGLEAMQARITGAGLKIPMDCAWDKDNKPFQLLDILMKDGTIYRSDNSEYPAYNGEQWEVLPEEENIRSCDYRCFSGSEKDNEWSVYSVSFCDYINVDDIDAVYADGVKLTLE